ncbi:MAG: tetratricopeptide repeat protein, partial [Treponema porcinum]
MIGVLIAIITGAGLICILMAVSGIQKKSANVQGKGRSKNNVAVIRDCTKKISKDPHNVEALKTLADIYYTDLNYERAFPLYQTLFKLMGVHVEIDQQVVSQRYGVCAFKLGKFDEAMAGFSKVLRLNPKDYEVNLYVGKIMLEKKDFEKSILCLKRAASIRPDSSEIYEPLGFALFEAKKYRESLMHLKKVLDENPENKQALFYFANAMEECSMSDKALKIFMHLRPDTKFGPESCVEAGRIHEKMGQYDKAV